jgi:antitoxin YefM
MSTLPVNEAQLNLQGVIERVTRSGEPITITSDTGNAVLVSQEDWSGIQETLYLLSMPGMRESIVAGLATPLEECVGEIDW